jgi:hypothetical protein
MSTVSTATPALEILSTALTALRPRMEAVSLAIHARPERGEGGGEDLQRGGCGGHGGHGDSRRTG